MPIFSKTTLYCPVCKKQLGERIKNELIIANCDECKCTFIWKGTNKLPESSLKTSRKKEQRYCSKDGCICHD